MLFLDCCLSVNHALSAPEMRNGLITQSAVLLNLVTYIFLLLCRGRAVGPEEVVPVEVFGCNEPGPLLSDSAALLGAPPVFIQIQPAT